MTDGQKGRQIESMKEKRVIYKGKLKARVCVYVCVREGGRGRERIRKRLEKRKTLRHAKEKIKSERLNSYQCMIVSETEKERKKKDIDKELKKVKGGYFDISNEK
jgi:hypothetical protein